MAARVVSNESLVDTVICLPCTVTVPSVTAMANPLESSEALVVTLAPTSVLPSCLAAVAS